MDWFPLLALGAIASIMLIGDALWWFFGSGKNTR